MERDFGGSRAYIGRRKLKKTSQYPQREREKKRYCMLAALNVD